MHTYVTHYNGMHRRNSKFNVIIMCSSTLVATVIVGEVYTLYIHILLCKRLEKVSTG